MLKFKKFKFTVDSKSLRKYNSIMGFKSLKSFMQECCLIVITLDLKLQILFWLWLTYL